jgi:hypothetical protein
MAGITISVFMRERGLGARALGTKAEDYPETFLIPLTGEQGLENSGWNIEYRGFER